MANTALIQEKLPQDLQKIAESYQIGDQFLTSMPDLIELVLRSKSMEKTEDKQSRFNLLPLMNEEQIEKLRDILVREKQKLEEIEKKYAAKTQEAVEKFVDKFDDTGYQKNMDQLKAKEAVHEEKEEKEAEALLTQI